MKILHLHLSLPDHRIEKAAYIARKAGHTCYFAGKSTNYSPSTIYGKDLFKGYFNLNFTPKNILGFQLHSLFANFHEITREVDFDIIHASNIYCAYFADKLNKPIIFDDREFYSYELKFISKPIYKLKDFFAHIVMRIRYPKFEKKIVGKWPLLTVSKKIIEQYNKIDANIDSYYFPNMPLYEEVKRFSDLLKTASDNIKTMYVGLNDFSKPISYRNTKGLLQFWQENSIGELVIMGDKELKSSKNVHSLGFVSQEEVFQQLIQGHIGLIGWKPHPYHQICSLNKLYNYVHTSLEPIYPSTLDAGKEISQIYESEMGEKFGFMFNNFNEINDYLQKNKEAILSREYKKINEIAQKHFVLNNYQKNLIDAYKKALEKG